MASIIGAKEIIGDIANLCDVPRTATLVAQTDLDVRTVSKENVLRIFRKCPEMALEGMQALTLRLKKTTRDLAISKAQATGPAAG